MKNTMSINLLCLVCLCLCEYVHAQTQISVFKEEHTIEKFDAIIVSGLPQVFLIEGASEKVETEISGMPAEDLLINSSHGILKIKTQGEHNGESIKVFVTYRSLKSIEVSGAAKLFSKNTIKAKFLDIHIHDAGEAELEVDVNAITIDLKDAGNLKVSGKTNKREVSSVGEQGTLNDSGLIASIQ